MNYFNVIQLLKSTNSSKEKLSLLTTHKDVDFLKDLFDLTYNTIQYTYWISSSQIKDIISKSSKFTLQNEWVDLLINKLATRELTWHSARDELIYIAENLSSEDLEMLKCILSRDLNCWVTSTTINKVWKDLIKKPLYMRCDVFSEWEKGTFKNINFPAIIQLKADWTYREVTVKDWSVTYVSRSGEVYDYPTLTEEFSLLPNWKYFWELLVKDTKNRGESNGLLNSDNIPHDRLILFLWDYVTLDEYESVRQGNKGTTLYKDRLKQLEEILINCNRIHTIEWRFCENLWEVYQFVSAKMKEGLEGWILKDLTGIFRDGTSKHQLKIKLEIEMDVRITWFTEGNKSRESTFGAITFENDEGTIKGQTSWFTQAQLEDFNSRRDELIWQIMIVQFNDLTKAEWNDYYALSHPRFLGLRTDKTETDTLERVFQLRDMKMNLETKEKKE